jgi:hypothetical protein
MDSPYFGRFDNHPSQMDCPKIMDCPKNMDSPHFGRLHNLPFKIVEIFGLSKICGLSKKYGQSKFRSIPQSSFFYCTKYLETNI